MTLKEREILHKAGMSEGEELTIIFTKPFWSAFVQMG
jgi:hypothetical protein